MDYVEKDVKGKANLRFIFFSVIINLFFRGVTMNLIKKNFKNIVIALLIFLFLGACALIFNLVKNQEDFLQKITGNVIIADPLYLIIESSNEDYLITNMKGNYQVGDEVVFFYYASNLDAKNTPKKIKVSDEELISTTILDEHDESLPQTSSSDNDVNNNTNINQNNQVKSDKDPTNSSNQSISNQPLPDQDSTSSSADAQILNYFNDLQNDFNATSIKDSVKSGFISVVDFLFYNGKIKGYTFDQLSSSAQLKVLAMALYFDQKIDTYFPGYKESISTTTGKTYTNLKEKIVYTYLNLTTSICANHSDLCTSAKEGFMILKTNFGLTWSLIKDIAKDGLTNLKDWYEIWSGK